MPCTIDKKMSPKRLSSLAKVEGNDDLLIEILLFLPAKYLVRFKLVSKRWRLLISAPSFCRLHTLRLPQTQPLFILGCDDDLKYLFCNSWVPRISYLVYDPSVHRFSSLPLPPEISWVRYLQSCNGLLLLMCYKHEERRSCYYVFNPTTGQHRDLSPLPFTSVGGIYLMFDPSLSPHYRVVSFAFSKENTLTRIYVYNSKTHKWKLRGKREKKPTSFCGGIHFNRGIYFPGRFYSCRFKPKNKLSEIPNPLPRHDAYEHQRNYAMESNGILLYLTLHEKQGTSLLTVCEMKKGKKTWTKYEADMNPILATCARDASWSAIHLLCMVRAEREEDSYVMLTFDQKIMLYRFYDNSFQVLGDVQHNFRDAHLLIQSLAPV